MFPAVLAGARVADSRVWGSVRGTREATFSESILALLKEVKEESVPTAQVTRDHLTGEVFLP